MLKLILTILLFFIASIHAERGRSFASLVSFAPCPLPTLANGGFRLQRNGKLIRYSCNAFFKLHGSRSSTCKLNRWEDPVPFCIKSGCESPPKPENGKIYLQNKNASVLMFCNPGYTAVGSLNAYCDGTNWDRNIGKCRETANGPQTSCDFENSDVCGWREDPTSDFDWSRRNGHVSFKKLTTGPSHDHTVMRPLEGYYLVAEATNQVSSNSARIISPIYDQTHSKNACFRLWYHMYGISIGRLRVYIRPVSMDMDAVLNKLQYKLYEMSGSQGNNWYKAFFEVEPVEENFQIVIEATAGKSIISDIAIDDVALLNGSDCIELGEKFTTEMMTDETGGIYDIANCNNRCNETVSRRQNFTINKNIDGHGGIEEMCDCHDGCESLESCCFDYRDKCFFAGTDADNVQTTTTDISQTSSIYSSYFTSSTTTSSPTDSSFILTSNELTTSTQRSTIKIRSTSVPTKKKTIASTLSTVKQSPSTPKSTTAKPTTKIVTKTKPIISISNNKLPKNVSTIETQNKIVKSIITTKIPKSITRKANLATSPMTKDQNNKRMSNIWMILIAITIAITLLLSLVTWKFYLNKKMIRKNCSSTVYKTKYYSKKIEEPLVCSDSCTIEDLNECQDNTDDEESKKSITVDEKITNDNRGQKAIKVHKPKLSNNKSKKYGSNSNAKTDDEYSEVRFLTSDDEHLDFELQKDDD